MKIKQFFIFLIITLFFSGFFCISKTIFIVPKSLAANTATINASIRISVCGNGIKEANEVCDLSDLGGKTCQSFGYSSGVLYCQPACDGFNTSYCITSGGGGGGGGGGGYFPPPTTMPLTGVGQVNFIGRAYPKSTVTLLKDAQIVATTVAGSDASFQISLSNINSGSYIFSVYSEDSYGNRSSLLTFPLSISPGVTTNVNDIFIAPTIDTDKLEVKKGEVINIFGQATPNSDITLIINSDEEIYGKTKTDQSGAYLYNLDTIDLEKGDHLAKSRATLENNISPLSKIVSFKVGDTTVFKTKTTYCGKADLNCDQKVNLVDFSILAYWYKRPSPPSNVDLNKDGKIDLKDFSILAYYWSG